MDDGLWGVLFWFAVAVGVALYGFWHTDTMIGRYMFAFSHDVQYRDVVVTKRPYNCDFWTAPIGEKHCSYEPVVKPRWFDGRRHIIVTWAKTED
jgi:hypothetical protein